MALNCLVSNASERSSKSLGVRLLEKVEVEVNRSGDSAKTATGEGPPSAAQASSDPVQESLKVLNEEALQLSEFLWQEEKLIKELCGLLKQV